VVGCAPLLEAEPAAYCLRQHPTRERSDSRNEGFESRPASSIRRDAKPAAGIIVVTKPGQKKPVSRHRLQRAGQAAARKDLKKVGVGELITKNTKGGRIRAKDTVPPGHDPRSRKG
jgi:hypothetical protein